MHFTDDLQPEIPENLLPYLNEFRLKVFRPPAGDEIKKTQGTNQVHNCLMTNTKILWLT
jgi:hypothetical protein